jgi:nucleotide-binding universal stress UspA family protein
MFDKILVAIDGSPAAEKALAAAVDLAARYRADPTALSIAEVPEVVAMIGEVDEMRQRTEEQFKHIGEAAVAFARGRGGTLRSVGLGGHAADAILRCAEGEAMNLIALGRHGHLRIARFFLGSTSDRSASTVRAR